MQRELDCIPCQFLIFGARQFGLSLLESSVGCSMLVFLLRLFTVTIPPAQGARNQWAVLVSITWVGPWRQSQREELTEIGRLLGQLLSVWKTPAWPAAWEIFLPQVSAFCQIFVAHRPFSSPLLSPKPQEIPGQGTMLPCLTTLASEWPLVYGSWEQTLIVKQKVLTRE